MTARYDHIGTNYGSYRQEDPDIRAAVDAALGDARTVINVGAGTGSYEPSSRYVVPVEPSSVMAAQRPPERPPALRCTAQSLPYADGSFDAAMALMTVHHWNPKQANGIRELRRVAKGKVLVLTLDVAVSDECWIFADYFPVIAERDHAEFPTTDHLVSWLGADVIVQTIPLSRHTPDGMLVSFWAHPERILDPQARAAASGFARTPTSVLDPGLQRLSDDLASGAWDDCYGHLRRLDSYDVGLRLITARPD